MISDSVDYILAGEDQQQTNQPNGQAGGLPWLLVVQVVTYVECRVRLGVTLIVRHFQAPSECG